MERKLNVLKERKVNGREERKLNRREKRELNRRVDTFLKSNLQGDSVQEMTEAKGPGNEIFEDTLLKVPHG